MGRAARKRARAVERLVRYAALGWLWFCGSGCVGAAPDAKLLELPGAARPEYADGERYTPSEKAARFEAMLDRFIAPEGTLTYIQPVGALRHVYRNLADSAIWTGCLLGAECMRYAVTGEEQARERALKLLDGLYALSRVTGQRGLYARSLWPRRSPMPVHRRTREGKGAYAAYRYRGDVSKDQIAGVVFGLSLAWRTLSAHARARWLVREQASALVDHLLAHGMRFTEAGRPTTHGDLMGYVYGVPIGVNALIALACFKLAAVSNPDPRYEAAYRRLVEARYPQTAWFSKFLFLYRTNHNNDNMQLLASVALLELERDPAIRRHVIAGLERTWRYVRYEGNAWFNYAILYGIGPDPEGLRLARRTLERFSLERRAFQVDLREDPRLASEPRAPITTRQHRVRLLRALPISYRTPSSFMWRSCPYALVQSATDQPKVFAPTDYLLAYWAGRYFFGPLAGLDR